MNNVICKKEYSDNGITFNEDNIYEFGLNIEAGTLKYNVYDENKNCVVLSDNFTFNEHFRTVIDELDIPERYEQFSRIVQIDAGFSPENPNFLFKTDILL